MKTLQADDRKIAAEMVRRFDLATADPELDKLLHRVSRYLMGTQQGQLGLEFRAWATDGRMSARLRKELTAYQLCVLDDSFVEGPHAKVGRSARATSKPSPSWWSSTIRLAQNFREYDRSVVEAPGHFDRYFDSWRLLGQSRASAYLAGQPARVRGRDLLRTVYRTEVEETQRDWTLLQSLADRTPEALPVAKASDMEVLLKEFLLAVVVPGSVVEVCDTRGVSSAELTSGQSQVGGQALVVERHFYHVVSRTLVGKKFVSTETLATIKSMRIPVVLQRLALESPDGHSEEAVLFAVPEGVPEAYDIRTFGSYKDLLRGLRVWKVAAITDVGHLQLVDRRLPRNLDWTVPRDMFDPVNLVLGSERGHSRTLC